MNKQTTGAAIAPEATVIHRINEAITEAGISINQLADETGISRPTLTRRLKTGRGLTFAETASLAAVLGMTAADLADVA